MLKLCKCRRFMSLIVILSLLVSVFFEVPIPNRIYEVQAAAPNGIAGNGLAGITIDVNASPYTDFATKSYGQYAYGTQGCAWFASARVNQLTGKGNTIYSGQSWYNTAYSTLGFSRGSELRAPAIACYKYHVVIVEKIVGDTVYISEGGMSGYGANASTGYTVIRAVNKSRMAYAGAESQATLLGYVYLTGSSSADTSTLSYANLSTEFVDNWNAGLYGEINNPSRATVSAVGAYVWDSAGGLVVNHTENCGLNNSTIYQRLNIVSEALPSGLRSGETYTYQLFAQANGMTYYSGKSDFTVSDSESPVITDAQITDITSDGYTVTCRATDNYQIDRVQFPTWTTKNDQDDLASEWWANQSCSGIRNGDTFTYYVKRSDHNGEYGEYHTHIYAYDKAGNWVNVTLSTEIKEEIVSEPTPTPTPGREENISEATPTPTPEREENISDPTLTPTPDREENISDPTLTPAPDNGTGTELTPSPKPDGTGNLTSQLLPSTTKSPSVEASSSKETVSGDTNGSSYADFEPYIYQVTGLKVKNKKGMRLKCTWKTSRNAWAYQIQTAKNRSFTKGKKTEIAFGTSETIYRWKKKTYYVRVRGYNYWNGRKVYGKWSSVKKVRIRK